MSVSRICTGILYHLFIFVLPLTLTLKIKLSKTWGGGGAGPTDDMYLSISLFTKLTTILLSH